MKRSRSQCVHPHQKGLFGEFSKGASKLEVVQLTTGGGCGCLSGFRTGCEKDSSGKPEVAAVL